MTRPKATSAAALIALAIALSIPTVVFAQATAKPAATPESVMTTTDWIGAIAAVVAAIVGGGALIAALWQIRTERKSRHAAAHEAAARERREQASKVSAWIISSDEHHTGLTILNNSEQPVYEVIVTMVFVQGAGPRRGEENPDLLAHLRDYCLVAPPGRSSAQTGGGWSGMSARVAPEIGFTDSHGVHWVRRATGELVELDEPATDFYRLARPLPWKVDSASDF